MRIFLLFVVDCFWIMFIFFCLDMFGLGFSYCKDWKWDNSESWDVFRKMIVGVGFWVWDLLVGISGVCDFL